MGWLRQLLVESKLVNVGASMILSDISEDALNLASAALSPADLATYYTRGQTTPWQRADHLDLINEAVVAAHNGVIKRIFAFVPPRYGKSHLIGRYTCAWWLGEHPDASIIYASHGHTRALDHSEEARNILEEVGPKLWGIRPRQDSKPKADWKVEGHNGGMLAAGVRSSITGRGADLFVIDDAVKDREEAFSSTIQERNWGWWKVTASSRFEPGGVLILIQTRWHELDLAGKMLELAKTEPDQQPIVVIKFPEWAVDKEYTEPVMIVGGENNRTSELEEWVVRKNADKRFHMKKGAVLWPWRWSLNAAKEHRATTDNEAEWEAVYQQNPQPEGGLIFKADHFQIISTSPVDAIRVRFWDLAATLAGGDYLAGVLMSYAPEDRAFYIEDVIRGQWDSGEVEVNMELCATIDGYSVAIRIEQEPGASGKLTVNNFKRLLGGYDVDGRRAGKAKHIRWRRMLGPMQRGNMYLVEGAWNKAFINELLLLPAGAHDDQADAAAGAYAELIDLDVLSPNAEVLKE